jgi:predicted negative regulator of RcsB-dependent stress response
LLLTGDIAAKLGHKDEAAARFRAAAAAPMEDAKCAERVQQIVREALAALGASAK